MTFLKNLSGQKNLGVPAAPIVAKANKAGAGEAGAFAGAQISEKVITKFGANLQPLAPEMKAVGQVALAMRPHRALQLSHSLDRFYGDLGKMLDRLPEQARVEAGRTAVGALAKVVDRVGTGERLVPAIETLSSLLFFAKPKENELAKLAEEASVGLANLLDALEGRSGAGTLLLGFRNLSEVVTKDLEKVDLPRRSTRWNAAVKFLLSASPAEGSTQGELGRLVGLYFDAALAEKDPIRALDKARVSAEAGFEGSRAALHAQLQVPPPVEDGHPGRAAHLEISGALAEVLDRHRVGPAALFEVVEHVLARVMELSHGITAEQLPAFRRLAELIRMVAGQPSARTVLEHLGHNLPNLVASPAAMAPLEAVDKVESLPTALLASRAAELGHDVAGYEAGLAAIKRLGSTMGTAVALAVLPQLAGGNGAEILLATAQFARTAETSEQVGRFAVSFTESYPRLAAMVPKEVARELASALAAELDGKIDPARAQFFGQAAVQVMALLPDLPIGKLARSDRPQEAGLLALSPQNLQNRMPLQYVVRLLQVLAGARNVPEDTKVGLARRAIHIGNEVARLDRDPETVMPRILDDWAQTLGDPAQLHTALKPGKKAGVQGMGQGSTLGFLEAHGELPAEVALTAGRHLSTEQITWLSEVIQSQRSHGKIRQLRDLVYGLVEAGRLDLLEALRTSPADNKAKEAVLSLVVQEYRVGRVAQLPFEQLRDGLNAGHDPVAPILAAQNAAALGAIFPAGAGVGALSQGHVAELKKHQGALQAFLQFFPDNAQIWNLPSATFKQPLIEWLKAYAEGRIAEHKYGSALADKQLAKLSPEARVLWSQEGVTAQAAAAPAADGPEAEETRQLLRGLTKSLGQVKLSSQTWPDLGFNPESAAKLSAARDQHLATLRAGQKGTPEHRTHSKALGPIIDRLSLIQLKLALDGVTAVDGFAIDPALRQVQVILPSAARAIRRFGGANQANVMLELAGRIKPEKPAAREGLYAADEDRLEAYLTSFGGGSCIDPVNGFNRPTIIEKMANPRYKMCRAMNGEQPQSRSFLRLMSVEIGQYNGLALWLDAPQATPGGNVGQEQQMLMYRHAMNKAMAMEVPFFCAGGYAQQVAQERGLAVQQLNVTVVLDRGVTGNHHTQYMAPIGQYGARWPDSTWNYGYSVAPALDQDLRLQAQVSVVFPPGLAP
jgi:hypothetical protein